jgi:hypothetical protein
MIGNIGKSGGDFLNAMIYCKYDRSSVDENGDLKIRGELVYFQNITALELYGPDIDLSYIADELHGVADQNTRTKSPVAHVSFSFPPGESPSNEVLQNIVKDYAKEFGLKENGLVAYKHVDKEHEHIHIIANKINELGKNTVSTSYDFLDMGHFSRKMENKYGLQSTKQMDSLLIDGKTERKSNPIHAQLRNHIDKMIPESEDLESLRVKLLQKGFKTKIGNGITFIQKSSGVVIKGSDLGREYSKLNLEKRIAGSYLPDDKFGVDNPKTTEKDKLKQLIKMTAPVSKTFPDFVAALNKEGYGVQTKDMINKKSGKAFTSILFTKNFSIPDESKAELPTRNSKMITGAQLGPEFKYSVINGNINKGTWNDIGHGSAFTKSKVKPESEKPLINKPNKSTTETSSSAGRPALDFTIERLLTSNNAGQIEADSAKSRGKIAAEVKRNASGYDNEFGTRGLEEMKEEKKKNLRAKPKKKNKL